MIVTTPEQERGMREVCRAIAKVRDSLCGTIRIGMSAQELDEVAGKLLGEHGVVSAPKAVYHFPGNICISVNECVAHGVPDQRKFQAGDAVNLDISGSLGGYFGDTGISLLLGEDALKQRVIECARQMFEAGREHLRPKAYLRDMAKAMQGCATRQGFSVVKKLCGHGIGQRLHDIPHKIYCHPLLWDNRRFERGQVLAIETFVAAGDGDTYIEKDRWSWVTCDHSTTAQYEHTLLITEKGPEILTL